MLDIASCGRRPPLDMEALRALPEALLNVIETFMNIAYVYLAHVAQWPGAIVIGFAAITMTLSKTILYWAQEYYCGYCAIGHNNLWNLIVLWIIPNGLWIVVPTFIVAQFAKDLVDTLNFADAQSKKISSAKKQ
uniref:Uncharacterized protein n=1 Tax=Psilocybe cubensis TaxID=181762 RepID=A0ACB8GK12_PSICU|nr:hypothetical protein JR316_0011585 [Psilocybe cubensis]KAH9476016.1 hypothetical protein JR316_0011585 [Psilocybe cubensis]